jgi:hypothetical protein
MLFTLVAGGYLGGGSAGYWSPYGYPLLLPPSLSHYQHYHNQLLLLQQAALLSPAHASASQVYYADQSQEATIVFDQWQTFFVGVLSVWRIFAYWLSQAIFILLLSAVCAFCTAAAYPPPPPYHVYSTYFVYRYMYESTSEPTIL